MISRVKPKRSFFSAAVKSVLACLTLCDLASAQLTGTIPQSPKQVVQAYRNMDEHGERLTASGWKKGNEFFLHPAPPPTVRVLGVMAAGEIIGEATINGDKAEVWTEFDFLGKVYPTGRFSRSLGGSPPVKGPLPSRQKYRLTLTGTQWKIDDFEANAKVTAAVAIHYLERLRDTTDQDDVKKNAERSIAELMAFQNERAK